MATEEVDFIDEEIAELLADIEDKLGRAAKLKDVVAKNERLAELERRIQRARQSIQSFKVEMRDLPKDLLPEYEERARGHQDRLQALQAKSAQQQGEVDASGQGRGNADEMSTAQVLQAAHQTQQKSVASVSRMKTQVAETKELAAATAAKLRSQTEQLQSVNEDVTQVRANLNRADRLLVAFMRKMATDRIIMVFVCLVFLALVAMVVVLTVVPREAFGGEGETPPPPTELLDPTSEGRRRLLGTFADGNGRKRPQQAQRLLFL